MKNAGRITFLASLLWVALSLPALAQTLRWKYTSAAPATGSSLRATEFADDGRGGSAWQISEIAMNVETAHTYIWFNGSGRILWQSRVEIAPGYLLFSARAVRFDSLHLFFFDGGDIDQTTGLPEGTGFPDGAGPMAIPLSLHQVTWRGRAAFEKRTSYTPGNEPIVQFTNPSDTLGYFLLQPQVDGSIEILRYSY